MVSKKSLNVTPNLLSENPILTLGAFWVHKQKYA